MTFLKQHHKIVTTALFFAFLCVEVPIYLWAAGQAGDKSSVVITDSDGRKIFETSGTALTTWERMNFENIHGPLQNYHVQIRTESNDNPHTAAQNSITEEGAISDSVHKNNGRNDVDFVDSSGVNPMDECAATLKPCIDNCMSKYSDDDDLFKRGGCNERCSDEYKNCMQKADHIVNRERDDILDKIDKERRDGYMSK